MRGGASVKRMRALLAHRDFRLFWLGQTGSAVGDRLVLVALALFVTDLTGSATDLGLVLGAHALPLVAFLLLGGVWADRLPRHTVVVVTDLVRFALHALLATLIFTGLVRIWHVVAIEAAFGTAEAFYRPARTGLIPQTVPEGLIQEANAFSGASDNVAELAGPALATALVVGAGAGWAFAVDAATFLLSAVLLARIRPRRRAEAATRRPFLEELRAGYRQVRSRTWVWATIAAFSLALFCGLAPFFVLGPIVARDAYGATSVYGVISTLFGVGAVLGAVGALRWRPQRPLRAGFAWCVPWPVTLALYGAGAPLVLVGLASVGFGAGFALFIVWWETALAERIPPAALSRVTSYDWMGSLALLPIGYVVMGPLADAFGAREVMVAGAGLTALFLALGVAPRATRGLRNPLSDVRRGPEGAPADTVRARLPA